MFPNKRVNADSPVTRNVIVNIRFTEIEQKVIFLKAIN